MKCPKCGYNSFETLESCTKCSTSLAAFKSSFGITPVVYRTATPSAVAQESMPVEEDAVPPVADTAWQPPAAAAPAAAADGDTFDFDFGSDSTEGGGDFSFGASAGGTSEFSFGDEEPTGEADFLATGAEPPAREGEKKEAALPEDDWSSFLDTSNSDDKGSH